MEVPSCWVHWETRRAVWRGEPRPAFGQGTSAEADRQGSLCLPEGRVHFCSRPKEDEHAPTIPKATRIKVQLLNTKSHVVYLESGSRPIVIFSNSQGTCSPGHCRV